MRLKHLLCILFLFVVVSSGYGQKKPYNNLIISEFRDDYYHGYVEITNMGTETIDLSEFELGNIQPWAQPWTPAQDLYMMLPNKSLAPGKSFVIAGAWDFGPEMWPTNPKLYPEMTTKPDMYKLADVMLHAAEPNSIPGLDSITPSWRIIGDMNHGRDCLYLRHHFINDEGVKDSMIIDQVGGIFDEADGTSADIAHDVAGVVRATVLTALVRRNSITSGIAEFSSTEANAESAKLQFSNSRGLDVNDSEWIPIPHLGGFEPARVPIWTIGNHVNAGLDANTLKPRAGSKVQVDLTNSTITVPWGVRNDDSLIYQFERKPGLAWHYDYAGTTEDSSYISVRTGDRFTLYVCGDTLTRRVFNLVVQDPTASDNIVVPKNAFDYKRMVAATGAYLGWVSDGIPGMDTISRLTFATRVDTLFKYLEKAPKANWEIVFKDGVNKPELETGDLLRVTSENGIKKDYFLKFEKYKPSNNAYLGSITWPDMPASFKGDIASSYGWKGDTIPSFDYTSVNYSFTVPIDYEGIPALTFTTQHLNSKVVVTRAKSLQGSIEDRTITFTVTAEDGITTNVYTVLLTQEKDPQTIQPFIGEPFFSRWIFKDTWMNGWLEICNPSTVPLDLSNYMITTGQGNPQDVFLRGTAIGEWNNAYFRYVPGKKWQDEASWVIQPAILETDMATNAIVYPGDVFVATDNQANWASSTDDTPYRDQIDIDFNNNPWGIDVPSVNVVNIGPDATYYMWKILNDSVKNGLKPATDILDFELIEVLGTGGDIAHLNIAGTPVTDGMSSTRKPQIYKPNPIVNASNGTTPEDSEWTFMTDASWVALGFPSWPDAWVLAASGIGSHNMDEITVHKSTVSSTAYKVSPGYGQQETILGLITGTDVTSFYANLIKANELQTLDVVSAANGTTLADADVITNGDTLIVLSADSTNTSKYILEVGIGLPSNALLTSTVYTIDVTGSTGTISGFSKNTPLKTVYEGVVVPAGATLTIIDQNDAYMTFQKLNYDSAYVDVIATDKIFFEVIAENGISKIVYQLNPTVNVSEAYVTSDVYSVDQEAFVISFVPSGTTILSLLSNLYPASGATLTVFDKVGLERQSGTIYRDDKLRVTSADGKTTVVYHFSMLSLHTPIYFAFVLSDDYQVNQINYIISIPSLTTNIADFLAKLEASFGATLKVINKDGNESTLATLAEGDVLLVTAADGNTNATYQIDWLSSSDKIPASVSSIKIYPNPTNGKVFVRGLEKGNRVQVINAAGIALRNVIVENSTDEFSLTDQPAGVYIFIISSGNQNINIQKIIKK